MGFKEDADFARFVAMGAVGTAVTADTLREAFGHQPIELERYASSSKVWQTKVKRLRVPDLVCARCGIRVEARAKSKLEIVLSHSEAPGRGWDEGGTRDTDLFAFMQVKTPPDVFPPEVSEPVFFTTGALRASSPQARTSGRKAASEGSEMTLKWPTWVPQSGGTIEEIADLDRVVWRSDNGKQNTYWQSRNWAGGRYAYLGQGQPFGPGDTIAAGVVEPPVSLRCPGATWDKETALRDDDPVERLAASKAFGASPAAAPFDPLVQVALDETEDWRVKLEARLALARSEPERWVAEIESSLREGATREESMEAVLSLAELDAPEAVDALCRVAERANYHQDIRAAAAWGIGQGANPQPERLLELMLDDDPFISVHAVAAVKDVAESMSLELLGWLAGSDSDKAAAAANVLARCGCVDVLLDAYESGPPARAWAVYALGSMEPCRVRALSGERFSDSLSTSIEPLWLREFDPWNTDDNPLRALDIQSLRFDPLAPTLRGS